VGLEKGWQDFVDTRLDTWKSIAQYLGRSSRTVQRWHAGYGLPVHHLGGDASSVYAYKDELDGWLRRRDGSEVDIRGRATPNELAVATVTAEAIQNRPFDRNPEQVLATEYESSELVAGAQKQWEALSASNLSTIARMYRKATDLDPLNSVAYAGLSQALIAQAVLGNLHPSAAFQTAEAALSRAVEINPELFEGLCASAMLKVFLYRDWDGAREALDRALQLHPKASQALVGRAVLMIAQGNLAEAADVFRRAAVERPLNTSIAELLCWVEYLSGRFESAVALITDARDTGHSGAILDTVEALCSVLLAGAESQIQRLEAATVVSRRNYTLLGVLGYAYGKAGEWSAARQLIDSMTRTGLTGVHDFAYSIALTSLGMGELREAARWLVQSYKHGSLWSLGFGSDPILAELRESGEFREFCGTSNYPVDQPQLQARNVADSERMQVLFSA
jgi:tetratricopeptide (TPR) repeat protein